MIIAAEYSFNKGREVIEKDYSGYLKEIREVTSLVNANECKDKESKEKTMPGQILFSPRALNNCFKKEFFKLSWKHQKVQCNYPTKYYTQTYKPRDLNKGAFREIDFVKGGLGIEVQFGKYAFMVYNVCAKMTIFNKLGYIKAGVEIVPVKQFADEMSTGVSYFEQFIWDLEARGVSDIDIPVLILGVDN